MKWFRELPSIHQHLIGLSIVLLMAILLLVLKPAVSNELILALGAAGVIWLVLSLMAWAIHTKRKSDPVEVRMQDPYVWLQKAYERAKATNDPRLADYEKRLSELTPDRRYFFGTTDINHGWRWYAFCYFIWLSFMALSIMGMPPEDSDGWWNQFGVAVCTFPCIRILTIMRERYPAWMLGCNDQDNTMVFNFLLNTYVHDGSRRWDWWLENDRYKGLKSEHKSWWKWLFDNEELL